MKIEVDRAEYADVRSLRERYRLELSCQIIRDSFSGSRPRRSLSELR
jgi:hypothetical protein